MSWTEVIQKRTRHAKHFTNGRKGYMQTVMGTDLHYQSDGWQEIDMRPVRIDNAQLDGWLINKNGWHYALGRPAGKTTDGWVGFGGKAGAHWLQFRLQRAGYLHWPTRTWQDVASNPVYDRADLSLASDPLILGPAGAQENHYIFSRAVWDGLWQTPGGGNVSIAWHAEGKGLKEEIVVNQAAREWIAANSPPVTAVDETYFGFVFELDAADIPQWIINGVAQNIDGDFDDAGKEIELRDEADELLAFLPLDYVYVEQVGGAEKLRLRKRFYQFNGSYYLVVGARVDQLNNLPAGDLIFDPSFSTQPAAAAGKDTWITKPLPSNNYGTSIELFLNANPVYDRKAFVEFDCSSIPAGSVASAVDLELTVGNQILEVGESIVVYSLHSNVADWTENGLTYDDYKAATSWPGSAGCNTSGTDYEAGSLGSESGPVNKNSAVTISLSTARVGGWFGATNTNYGLVLMLDSGSASVYSSDHGTASYRPKLSIEYEEAISEAAAVAYTAGPTIVQSSTTATPDAAMAVAYTSGPSIVQGSVPPTLLSYMGDIFLSSNGNQLSVCLLVTEGDNWRLLDSSSVIEQLGAVFNRQTGYVVPQ